jgi:N6-adenosine-specific RNA methylase IME4
MPAAASRRLGLSRILAPPSSCAATTLAALPVADLAADDCAFLEQIEAWGFEFKTVAFYWVKRNKHRADFFTGLGYWTRANPEICLLATRGNPRRQAKDVRKLVVAPRREHSRKPDCVRERIERLVKGPYLELFARETKPGWDCWGNQAGFFDAGVIATRLGWTRLWPKK